MSVTVRKAKKEDLDKVVSIHFERFPNFFLTTLGKSFLNVFYKGFLKDPGILLVLIDNNEIQGFAAGSRSNKSFFKNLVKNNFFEFTFSGIQILLTKPQALKRIFSNTKKAQEIDVVYAELLSIATVINKKGYGKILLDHFEKEVSRKNTENLPLSLTTDYENNEKAVKFYKDCGYKVSEVFESFQKRKMYRFIKNI